MGGIEDIQNTSKSKGDNITAGPGETNSQYNSIEPQQPTNITNQEEVNKGKQPWQAQVGWIYAGHGEWAPADTVEATVDHGNKLEQEPDWVQKWWTKNDPNVALHLAVVTGGYPYRWGARREVKSRWNLGKFQQLLGNYEDKEVVEWLKYGWPTGRLPSLPNLELSQKNHKGDKEVVEWLKYGWPTGRLPSLPNLELSQKNHKGDKEVVEWLKYGWPTGRLPSLPNLELSQKNHKGVSEFPKQLQKYIAKEQKYGAVMGPFNKIPFATNIGILPLSTRPKKGSEDRRIILDLSFPVGKAVNDGIPKDAYLGFTAKLMFPKTDDFGFRIFLIR